MTYASPVFEVCAVDGNDRPADIGELLYNALYADYGVPRESGWLHIEDGGRFVAARDSADGSLLGVVRLMPPGVGADVNCGPDCAPDNLTGRRQIRQVVVAPAARRRGIGRALMGEVAKIAAAEGATSLWLNSRHSAYEFYADLGFVASGEEFLSALTGIPHRYMEMRMVGSATPANAPAESCGAGGCAGCGNAVA